MCLHMIFKHNMHKTEKLHKLIQLNESIKNQNVYKYSTKTYIIY